MPRLRPDGHPTLPEELRLAARLGSPLEGGLPPSEWPRTWKEVFFKDLAQLDAVALPDPPASPLLNLIRSHESSRSFDRIPVTKAQISGLLQGISINRHGPGAGFAESQRTYPSAGARYPIDTYPLVLHSEQVDPGAYFFDPRDFSIRLIEPIHDASEISVLFGESWTADASLALFFVAQWQRTEIKYAERGYAFACIEAGHMAQNLVLLARGMGLRVCPLGGFASRGVEKLLHLVAPEEGPLYCLVIGAGRG